MTGEIIGDYYNRLKEEPYKRLEAEECERILNGIKGVGEERVVVTTHAYLTQLQESFLKSFIVIIDEDFLQLQVFNRMHTVSMKCLKELEERGAQGYSGIVSEMLRSEEGKYNKAGMKGYIEPFSSKELEELNFFGPGDDINDLAQAGRM